MNNNLKLNDTQKLILLSATTQLSESTLGALQILLKSHIDWPFLIQFSVSQGTAPFLYKLIKNKHLESLIPEPVYKALEAGYYQTYSKNVLAQEALKEVLKAFSKASIKTLLIKGMASAQYIYKDPGLRPMSDIDLLVEKKNLLIAEQILFDMGYKNACPYKSFKLRTLNIYNHLNAFTKANTKIELHHDLSSSHHIIRFPSEKVWEDVREVYLGNEKTHILKDEWNLIYLSIHLITHFIIKNIRLNNFIDIAELIKMRSNELNWDFIVGQCKIYNVSSPVFSAFSICRTYFNAPIPDGVMQQLDDGKDNLETQFLHLINNRPEKIIYKTTANYFKKIGKINGLINKLKYLWSEAFPSKAYMVYSYNLKNKSWYFLFYFIQPLRQTFKMFSNIFLLLKRAVSK